MNDSSLFLFDATNRRSNDGAATDRIPAWRAIRTTDLSPAFSSSGSVRSLTNQLLRYSRQRVHNRPNNATVAALRRGVTTRYNQANANTDAESDQGNFAGILTSVINRLPVLFIQALVRLIINLAGLPLRLIYHLRASLFHQFAHRVGGIT